MILDIVNTGGVLSINWVGPRPEPCGTPAISATGDDWLQYIADGKDLRSIIQLGRTETTDCKPGVEDRK